MPDSAPDRTDKRPTDADDGTQADQRTDTEASTLGSAPQSSNTGSGRAESGRVQEDRPSDLSESGTGSTLGTSSRTPRAEVQTAIDCMATLATLQRRLAYSRAQRALSLQLGAIFFGSTASLTSIGRATPSLASAALGAAVAYGAATAGALWRAEMTNKAIEDDTATLEALKEETKAAVRRAVELDPVNREIMEEWRGRYNAGSAGMEDAAEGVIRGVYVARAGDDMDEQDEV